MTDNFLISVSYLEALSDGSIAVCSEDQNREESEDSSSDSGSDSSSDSDHELRRLKFVLMQYDVYGKMRSESKLRKIPRGMTEVTLNNRRCLAVTFW